MHDLQLLILRGESDTLEFKKTITSPDRIARTIVSFANAHGGQILVGVQDNGSISGVDPEEEKHTLDKAITYFCDPPVRVIYKEVELEEGTVLKVIIPESDHKPHLAKVKENDWRSYVRVRDESVQTSLLEEPSLPLAPAKETLAEQLAHQEKMLLELLAHHRRLTVKQIMQLTNLSKFRIQNLLVDWVLDGRVQIHDQEKEPFYTIS